jgi:hypothetical protein
MLPPKSPTSWKCQWWFGGKAPSQGQSIINRLMDLNEGTEPWRFCWFR